MIMMFVGNPCNQHLVSCLGAKVLVVNGCLNPKRAGFKRTSVTFFLLAASSAQIPATLFVRGAIVVLLFHPCPAGHQEPRPGLRVEEDTVRGSLGPADLALADFCAANALADVELS